MEAHVTGERGRRSGWSLDVAIALGLCAVGLAELTGVIPGSTFPGSTAVAVAFVVLTAAPLVVRSTFPMSAFLAVVVVTTVWQYALYAPGQQPPFEPFLALLLVTFGAGAFTRDRAAAAAVATIGVGIVLAVVDVLSGAPLGIAVPPLLMIVGVFLLGRLVAGYRQHAAESAELVVVTRREADQAQRLAVAQERTRIARELHDVVSHDVSLIVLQASVERRLQDQSASGNSVEVLANIERAGRDALAELRRMLGVLRDDDGPAPLEPQPGLDQLDGLLADVRAAGVDVRVERTGDLGRLPAGLDLAAYRVVQESLTNVTKHVGPTRVQLGLDRQPDELVIEVVDEGPSRPSDLVGGHGLAGMRERVALYGGTLTAAPHGSGFRVLARLPLLDPDPA